MRFRPCLWILPLLASLLIPSAHAQNRKVESIPRTIGKPYSFSFSERRCKDAEGKSGFNRGSWGQCTDFTLMTLNSGKHKHRLQREGLRVMASTFEGSNLSGLHIQSSDFRFVNFQKANLQNVVFEKVNLRGADFRGTDLSGTRFVGSNHYLAGDNKKAYQLDGALVDDSTDLRSLLTQELNSPQAFAFSKNMIWLGSSDERGVDYEMAGATLTGDTKWDEYTQTGSIKLDLYVKSKRLKIQTDDLYQQIQTLKAGSKVRVGIQDDNLVFIEALEY